MSRGRRGPSQIVQRALGWTKLERRDVGSGATCACGAVLDYSMDRIGRVDYKRPFCPLLKLCPARPKRAIEVRP